MLLRPKQKSNVVYVVHVFVVRSGSEEYRAAMIPIMNAVQKHVQTLVKGKPQLNVCDKGAQVRDKGAQVRDKSAQVRGSAMSL